MVSINFAADNGFVIDFGTGAIDFTGGVFNLDVPGVGVNIADGGIDIDLPTGGINVTPDGETTLSGLIGEFVDIELPNISFPGGGVNFGDSGTTVTFPTGSISAGLDEVVIDLGSVFQGVFGF
jgi:hypothetical protein